MSRILRAAICFVGIALFWITPARSSTTTALGYKTIEAHGLMSTEAVVVAKLVKRVHSRDEAYLVFEKLRVLRSKEPPSLLVFHHPELFRPKWPSYYHVFQDDLDALVEGKIFLLELGQNRFNLGEHPAFKLIRWKAMTGADDVKAIESRMKVFRRLDRNLKIDPWKAIEYKDLFVHGCADSYYRSFATQDQVEKILLEYHLLKTRSHTQHRLAYRALERAKDAEFTISPVLLKAIYDLGDAGPYQGFRRMIQAKCVLLLARVKGAQYDSIFLESLAGPVPRLNHAAMEVLKKKKVAGAAPILRDQLPMKRVYVADALVFQTGTSAVKDILELCVRQKEKREEYVKFYFSELAENVGATDITALRSLKDGENSGHDARISELLVCAGDKKESEQYLEHVKRGNIRNPPHYNAPRSLRYADKWRKATRWGLKSGQWGGGYKIDSAVKILIHLKDPELPDLLVNLIHKDSSNTYAYQFLAMAAQEKHREMFQRNRQDKDARIRLYAYAGLAKLGDKDARLKVIQLMALAPDSMTRYYAKKDVMQWVEVSELKELWRSTPPRDENAIKVAVHHFVMQSLDIVDKKSTMK